MNDSDSDNEMPSEQPRHTTSSAARRRRRSNARQAWFTQQQNYQNSSSTTTDSEPTNSNSDSASSSSSRGRRHSDRSRNSSSTRSTTRNESQFMSESRTRGIISSIQRTQITELQPGTDVNAWRLSAENAVRLAGAHYALYTSHESAQQLHVNEVLLALIRKSVAPQAGASLVAERATTAKEAWKHILDVIMPDTPRAETALWTELRAVSQGSESWETFAGHVMSVHAKILHFYQRRALVKMDDSVIINEDKAVSEISKARKLAEQQASATMPEQALIQILIAGTSDTRSLPRDTLLTLADTHHIARDLITAAIARERAAATTPHPRRQHEYSRDQIRTMLAVIDHKRSQQSATTKAPMTRVSVRQDLQNASPSARKDTATTRPTAGPSTLYKRVLAKQQEEQAASAMLPCELANEDYSDELIDEISEHLMMMPLKIDKTAQDEHPPIQNNEYASHFVLFLRIELSRGNHMLQTIRSDNDPSSLSEFVFGTTEFDNACRLAGVEHKTSPAYHQSVNGHAERVIHEIYSITRTLTHAALLTGTKLTGLASTYANLCRNGHPTSRAGMLTPWKVAYPQTQFPYQLMKIWGCVAYVHTPRDLRHHAEPTARQGIFVGIKDDGKDPSYLIYMLDTHRVVASIDVTFDESQIMDRLRGGPALPAIQTTRVHPRADARLNILQERLQIIGKAPETPQQTHDMPAEEKALYAMVLIAQESHAVPTPRNYVEAITSPHREHWIDGMVEEQLNHWRNSSYRMVAIADLPPDAHIYPSIWAFRTKCNADGTIKSFKTRDNIDGRQRRPGMTTIDTYASVANVPTILIFHALVGMIVDIHGVPSIIETGQGDAVGAYLQTPRENDKPPCYFQQAVGFHNGRPEVRQALSYIYGDPEAATGWQNKLKADHRAEGYLQMINDRCIYRKVYDDGHWTASASVVDDLKPLSTRPCDSIKTNADATVTSPSHLDEYFAAMSKHIKLTRNDNDTFIGIHTEQTADGFALTQQGYIISNAERLAPPNIRATTPVISTREIQRAPGPPHQDDVSFCQAAAGSMIYLPTRPDILAARRIVSTLATMASPDVVQAAQQCWAYLRDTAERGTRSFPEEADGQLYVYADCHRGIHETLVMYLIILNAVVIDCAVNRVHLHSSSSGEGEMHAVHKPINKVIHHRNLLTELGIQQHGPTKIFCDAKVVADVIIKDGPHQRLAHVGAKVVRVRETQRDGIIEIEQVPRELQLADILGKPRGPSEFTPMRDVIVPPAGVLTDAQITHRLRYPHVSHSRRNVELAQQKRSNN